MAPLSRPPATAPSAPPLTPTEQLSQAWSLAQSLPQPEREELHRRLTGTLPPVVVTAEPVPVSRFHVQPAAPPICATSAPAQPKRYWSDPLPAALCMAADRRAPRPQAQPPPRQQAQLPAAACARGPRALGRGGGGSLRHSSTSSSSSSYSLPQAREDGRGEDTHTPASRAACRTS
jgi:hypothetical protein